MSNLAAVGLVLLALLFAAMLIAAFSIVVGLLQERWHLSFWQAWALLVTAAFIFGSGSGKRQR